CKLEIAKLQQKLKILQNQLLLGEWQLKDLKEHKYYWVKSKETKFKNHEIEKDVYLPTTSGSLIVYDHDCSAVYNSGKTTSGYYRVRPKSIAEPFLVYCDMLDGGGWTVFQRRSNGKVNFNRGWNEYKSGFGLFQGKKDEYWLGNDYLHALLSNKNNLLKIDLMDWKGVKKHAFYEDFQIKDEKDNYGVEFGTYSGDAGDALSGGANFDMQWSASHQGMSFSTPDRDNDRFLGGNCATENNCGWWFNRTRCHAANLNGHYYKEGVYQGNYDNGIIWVTWQGFWYSLKYTAMKVRPPSFIDLLGSGDG
uniref:Fibrinogen like 1B n=1 Tax=Latimeria chalumnae TaxID=7897 RepID=H3ADR9_LATCH